MHEQPSRSLILGTAIVAGLCGGCATAAPRHVGAFSTAAGDLADHALTAYRVLDDSIVERKIADVAADTTLLPDDGTFEALFDGSSALRTRVALLTQLRDYATALGALSYAEDRSAVDRASAQLQGALRGLESTFEAASREELPLSSGGLSLVATGINAIGRSVTEARRQKAIKSVVFEADPAIQRAARLLTAELPGLSELARSNVETSETELIKAYQSEAVALPFEKRRDLLRRIRATNRLKKALPGLFRDLAALASGIGATHAALREVVEKDRSSRQTLLEGIGTLVELGRSIEEFSRSTAVSHLDSPGDTAP